ncbi:MAG TPA: hypothetical protein VKZ79_10145 [Alphaproteobacteria bacterium]|nr:hypothetical protein [Alphaproteobacteria bacterium]
MGELVEGALVRTTDRCEEGPRSLAEELDFLDAYGRPFPGGMLDALIQDSDTAPALGPAKPTQCEVIYWQFRTAADRRHRSE